MAQHFCIVIQKEVYPVPDRKVLAGSDKLSLINGVNRRLQSKATRNYYVFLLIH
jgi:hypothetical protein